MSPEDLQINELAQRAGVTVRTIRYYIDEGLLPPPDTKGRYAAYSEDYLDRLRLIGLLKEAFLPLKEIRDKVGHLSAEEVRELLRTMEAQWGAELGEQEAPPGRQLPLEGVPRPPSVSQEPLPIASAPPDRLVSAERSGPPGEEDDSLASAREYLNNILSAQTTIQPRRLYSRSGPPQETEDWQRIPLAPGVELHIRQPVPTPMRDRMRQLVEFARKLFAPYQKGGTS